MCSAKTEICEHPICLAELFWWHEKVDVSRSSGGVASKDRPESCPLVDEVRNSSVQETTAHPSGLLHEGGCCHEVGNDVLFDCAR